MTAPPRPATHPKILLGGATLSDFGTLLDRARQLFREAGIKGGSYYYFAGHPALSQFLIPLAVLAALVWLVPRPRHWAVVGGWGASVFLYVMSGRGIGMRRGVPIVVFSVLALGLVLPHLWTALCRDSVKRAWRLGVAALGVYCLAFTGIQCGKTVYRFATGLWKFPDDYGFPVMAGKTQAQTYDHLLRHPGAIHRDCEPDRTLSVLYFIENKSPELVKQRGRVFTTHEAILRLKGLAHQ